MKKALLLKFKQNRGLGQKLISTGTQYIVHNNAKDKFWGIGGDGTGLNKLGLMLMEVREELRKGNPAANKVENKKEEVVEQKVEVIEKKVEIGEKKKPVPTKPIKIPKPK